MAVRIRFDTQHNPELPIFVLATRSGKKLGLITNISNVHIGDHMNSPMDISFSVHKSLDIDPVNYPDIKNGYLAVQISDGNYFKLAMNTGASVFMGVYDEINNGRTASEIWDEIKNFRKVWVPDWDKWFTLTYSVDESDETIKNVSLVPNSEFELSNVNVHNLEINTESDILRDNYEIPTTFYNVDHPEASLLHRILSYTKGFVIKHVDDSLKNIQRTFALDGKNIYDTLQEVAQEIQCLFVFDSGTYADDGSIERAISAYDLKAVCNSCGHRGDFFETCPKCGSTDILGGYGYDTSIYVDTDALAESINLSTDTDAVKNCFRLLSGDGLMDAAIIASNPNGSQYIWYFTDEMMEDMSLDLKRKLSDYDVQYEYYENDYTIPMSNATVTAYNAVVERYTGMKEDLVVINDIIGYAELMNAMYDVMDFQIYLESGLLPSLNFDTNAQEQAAKITRSNMPYVAIQNLNERTAQTTVNSAVEAAVKILLDQRYTAKIHSSDYNASLYLWTGNFDVTANSDKEDTALSDTISIAITDTYETFAKQRIEKAIAQSDKNSYSMAELFTVDIAEFRRRLKMYSRAGLRSILESCNAAIGVMVELGISNPTSAVLMEGGLDAYYEIYLPYILRLREIENEVSIRDQEISVVQDFYDMLMKQKHDINDKLDINKFLGEELAIELNSYKMEDDFQNSNYISEGLDNAQLFKRAAEFVEIANNEIRKAATEHHSISTTMRNLLTIEEFEPLVDYFATGNWIRIRIDGKVYRVKLLSYSIDFDNIENLQVEFSDTIGSGDAALSDVFASAQSMAKSYDSIKYQAVSGASGRKTLNSWVQKGLDLTTVRVMNSENQTLQLDQNGMSMAQYDDVTQAYTDYGSRWINTTLAFTKDNWETTETALGKFEYWDPRTEQYEEGYGVVAKQIIGNIILGNEVGIYNQNSSITLDEGGLTITANGDDGVNMTEFTIQRQYTNGQGQIVTDKQLYIDESGKLVYKGELYLESGKTIEEQMADINTQISEAKTLNVMLQNESHVVPTDKDGNDGDFTDCNTQVFVFYGNTEVTNAATITPSVDPRYGITGSWNATTKTYYVSDMTADSGKVQFTVQFDNLQATKSMSIGKAKAGGGERGTSITGVVNYYLASDQDSGIERPVGDTWSTDAQTEVIQDSTPYLWNYEKITYSSGNPTYTSPVIISRYAEKATRYDIVVSHAAVLKMQNGTYSPTAITMAGQKQVGDGNLTEYAGRFKIETTLDNEAWTTVYPENEASATDETTHTFTVPTSGNIVSIRCQLYQAGGYTTLFDRQTIPVATGGTNGYNQATVYLYQRASADSTPNVPSSTLTYTFSNGSLTPTSGLGSWKRKIDSSSGNNNPLWITFASASNVESTDEITSSDWSTPVIFAEDGGAGTDGYNQATLYLYQRKSTAPQISSSASFTYNFTNGTLSGIPTGWQRSIPAVNANRDPCWVTTRSVMSRSTSTTFTGGWSGVVKLVEDGVDGNDGADGYTVVLTNESHTFAGTTTAAVNNGSVDCQVIAYKGANPIAAEITSISGTISGKITATINQSDKSIFTAKVTNQLTQGGILTINISVDGKTFQREFSYSIAFQGDEGRGIDHIVEWYKVSNDPTNPPTGDWQTDMQATSSSNRYLWNYETIYYTSGDPENSTKRVIGTHGLDGSEPTIYMLVVSDNVVIRTADGVYQPSSITLTAKSQTGNSGWQDCNAYFTVVTVKPNGSKVYMASNRSSYTFNIPSDNTITALDCSMSIGNQTVDSQTVPIIAQAKDGTPGYNQATIYLYKRSERSVTPTKPNGELQYTFSDKTLTPSSALNGWVQNPDNTTGSDPLWVIVASASSTGASDSIPSSEWSTPIPFEGIDGDPGQPGQPGSPGLNQATVFLYQRKGSAPSKPGSVTYTFSSGAITTPSNNWVRSIPTSDGNPCWVTTGVAIGSGTTATISSWSDVVKLVENGAHGVNTATIYLYKRSASSPSSSKPNGNLTYTFSSKTITGDYFNSWVQNPNSTTGSNALWMIAATASSATDSDTISKDEWTDPIKVEGKDGATGAQGASGDPGLNHAIIYLYKRADSTPTKPTGNFTYDFTTGKITSHPSTTSWSDWVQSIPATNGKPCWMTTNVAIASTNTVTVSSGWSDVVKLVEDGDDAYTVLLTNENHTFAGTTTAAKSGESVTLNVLAYKGVTQVNTRIGTITQPSGITVSPSPSSASTSTKITISVNADNTVTSGGVINIPIIADDGNFSITKQFSYSIAYAGEGATIMYLITSPDIIIKKENGTFSPNQLTVDAYSKQGNGTALAYPCRFVIQYITANSSKWDNLYDTNDTTRITSGESSRTQDWSGLPSGTIPIAFRCLLYKTNSDDLLDQQTIPIVSDGISGGDAYTVFISDENHTFSGTSTGAVATSTTFNVVAYKGTTQVATKIGTLTKTADVSGVTITDAMLKATVQSDNTTSTKIKIDVGTTLKNGGKLTIPITVDNGTSNARTFTLDFTWSIALAGEPTRSYMIDASTLVIKKQYTNILSPTQVTFNSYYRDGTGASRTAYNGYFKIYEDGAPKTTKQNMNSFSYTPSSVNVKIIKCELYANSGFTTLLDTQSVAILADVEGMSFGSRNLIRFSDTLIHDDYGFFGRFVVDQSSSSNDNLMIDQTGEQIRSKFKRLTTKMGVYPVEDEDE